MLVIFDNIAVALSGTERDNRGGNKTKEIGAHYLKVKISVTGTISPQETHRSLSAAAVSSSS